MDGYVTIGTRLDTKELEKDLKNAERQLKQYEREAEKLTEQKLKVETEVQEYERQKQLIEESTNQRLKFAETEEQVNFVLGEEAIELSKLNEQYNQTFINLENINSKMQSNTRNQALLNDKVSDLKGEINKVKGFEKIKNSISEATTKINEMGRGLRKVASSGINSISKKIDNVGKSVNNVTKKILRWGLALFGIRTAYNFIRSSISSITQENESIANQVNLMKNALTVALEPAIKVIISLLYTLFSFVNSIVKELTGKDLFATASENMKKGAKSAKEMNKQLASFDEMNILSDNSSSTQFNTEGFIKENTKLLKILEKFKKMVIKGDWAKIGKTISKAIINGLNGLADKIKSIDWSGIGKKISDFLTNLDFSGMLVALVRVFGEALLKWQDLILTINWPKIFANLSQGLADAIFKIDDYIKQIKWEEIANMVSETFTSIKWGELGSSILQTIWDVMKGLLTLIVNLDWGKIGETISESLKKWITTIIENFKTTNWEEIGEKIATDIADFIEHFDWIGVGGKIITLIYTGMTAIETLIKSLISMLIKRVLKGLGLDEDAQKVGKDIAESIIEGLTNAFKINPLKISISLKPDFTKFGSNIGYNIGKKIKLPFAKGGIVVPKLASGGIINQPGRGVPIGSAIGGERGAEGIIPLTDSQQMELLGEAIGRYITINATIPVYAYNRQVDRQIRKFKAEDNFASNH